MGGPLLLGEAGAPGPTDGREGDGDDGVDAGAKEGGGVGGGAGVDEQIGDVNLFVQEVMAALKPLFPSLTALQRQQYAQEVWDVGHTTVAAGVAAAVWVLEAAGLRPAEDPPQASARHADSAAVPGPSRRPLGTTAGGGGGGGAGECCSLAFLAWIGSPCLRHCVHGAPVGGDGGARLTGPRHPPWDPHGGAGRRFHFAVHFDCDLPMSRLFLSRKIEWKRPGAGAHSHDQFTQRAESDYMRVDPAPLDAVRSRRAEGHSDAELLEAATVNLSQSRIFRQAINLSRPSGGNMTESYRGHTAARGVVDAWGAGA
jgi:hypothetical protein